VKRILGPATTFFPTPCVLVVSGDAHLASIAMVAWAGVVNGEPPMIGIAMRPQTHAYALLKEYGEFTVNIPHEGMLRQIDVCAVLTGMTIDKFSYTNLTKLPSKHVSPPIIAEAVVSLECEVHETHALVIGEVVQVHVDETILGPEGQVLLDQLKPIVCCPINREYRAVGQKLEDYGFSKGKTD